MANLSALLNVESDEGRLVGWMFFHSFLLGAANNFLQAAAFALFLVRFNAQSLAWVYIANALVVPLLVAVYIRLGTRLAFKRLLAITLGFVTLLVLVFWLGLRIASPDWLIFGLPILFQVLVNFGNLEFWGLAGRLFDVRQGKRLFGLIGAGQWLAIVLTGFLIPWMVSILGTANLLFFSALGAAGAFGTLFVIRRYGSTRLREDPERSLQAPPASRRSITSLLRSRYVLLIFALVSLWWLAFFFLDNIFYDRAAIQFPDEQELAGFLGIFLAGLGIITLISNTLLSGRVISSFGMRTSLLILPVVMVFGSGGMSLAGALGASLAVLFWFTIGTKLMNMAIGFSIDRAALSVLYQPFPVERRGQIQAAAEGFFQPLANGLAGVGLLALAALFAGNRLPLIYALFVISAAWLLVAYLIGREYPRQLTGALTRRRLDSTDLETLDAGSLQTLDGYLSSSLPEEVIYAMNMLQSFDPASLEKSLPVLIDHPAEQVRRHAFEIIERLLVCSALPQVEQRLLVEQNPAVRAAGVQAYARLEECGDYFEKVSVYLDDPDPLVQRGAMVGLLHSGGIAGVLAAGQNLLRLAQSEQPEERATAAQTLERIGASRYYQPLIPLLQDPDPGVQRAALLAAGSLKNPRLWPVVIALLENHPVRNAAAAALTNAGESVLPALIDLFSRPGQTHPVQELVLRICGRIGSPAAGRWLFEHISSPDGIIRTHSLRALNYMKYRADFGEASQVIEQIHAEMGRAAELLAILRDMGRSEEVWLIRNALLENLDRGRERIFLLLALTFDRRAVLGARDNLNLPSPEKRAYAMEVLDVLLPVEIKREVFLFLTDWKVPGRAGDHLLALFPQNEASLPQRLVEVIASPPGRFSAWTQACALYSAGSLKSSVLSPIAIRALASPNPLLRETAIWTLHRLEGVRAREHTAALVEDPDPFVAQTAKQLQRAHPEVIVLTTIEKVLALKKTSIFAETPDEVLLQVAPLLEERRVEAGGRVIEKDDLGDCMYILVDGEMRVHDGERTLNVLGPGTAFGEIAVLDTEPRTASVTAQSSSLLLRLAQESLYEAMDAHPQVARGIIRALSHSLRARVQDVQVLSAKLENPEQDMDPREVS